MKTSRPSLVLILISLGAWTLLLAEIFTDFLAHHAFIATVVAAGLAPACFTALHVACRIEAAISAHAGRFERAVECHKAAMADLNIEQSFKLGMYSDRIAKTEADDLPAPSGGGDTGPFWLYKRQ